MKDRPILMNAPMVRATLADVKRMTRRAVKFPHQNPLGTWEPCASGGTDRAGVQHPEHPVIWHTRTGDTIGCPFGVPGDRLWVRESFWGCDMPGHGDQPCVVYDDEWQGGEYKPAAVRPWARKFGRIPSIHMPREASRITLEIVSVRVERLQDISEADARAEGIAPSQYGFQGYGSQWATAAAAFPSVWQSIYGTGSWDANPWVWIIEFKRLP